MESAWRVIDVLEKMTLDASNREPQSVRYRTLEEYLSAHGVDFDVGRRGLVPPQRAASGSEICESARRWYDFDMRLTPRQDTARLCERCSNQDEVQPHECERDFLTDTRRIPGAQTSGMTGWYSSINVQ